MKKFIANLVRSLLPVNPFAGKLRLLLLILFLFIFWTFTAQNMTGNLDSSAWFSGSSGFIADILGELAGRYFHPGTLGLTLTPLILFLLARRRVATFFSGDGFLDQKTINHFLKRCVFSINDQASQVDKTSPGNKTQILGGPADLQISAGTYLVIEDMRSGSFNLLSGDGTPPSRQHTLEYGKRVTTELHAGDLSFQFSSPQSNSELRMRITFQESSVPGEISHHQSHPLSADEAAFLVFAKDQKDALRSFIQSEAERFYIIENEVENEPEESVQASVKPSMRAPRRSHDNYAHTLTLEKASSRGFTRPHKRTQFSLPYAVVKDGDETKTESQDSNLSLLNSHFQQELVSFFSLTHVQVSIE